VDERTANDTACRMEHAMNKDTFKKFQKFVAFMDACPTRGNK
jgi:DtxR family Mn-dependent transcriptional regulator